MLKEFIIVCLVYGGAFANLLRKREQKTWSILICTLKERKAQFDHIYNKLMSQIKALGLEQEIEVLYFCDNREHSVGYKRNFLLKASAGRYINYVDDDDDVHDHYVQMIYEKLQHNPDCVSLVGVITFDAKRSQYFVHSIKYKSYFSENNVFYRPPNHLNPIRKSIAIQFPFPEISFGEDTNWAMQIARSGLLKIEEEIKEPYYFYNYVSNKRNIGEKYVRAKKLSGLGC